MTIFIVIDGVLLLATFIILIKWAIRIKKDKNRNWLK